MSAVATNKPPYCIECKLTFSSFTALRKHERKLHQQPCCCTECNLTFSSKKVLGKHKRKLHPKTPCCAICGLIFSGRKQKLEKVALRKHKQEAHMQCKQCKKRFLGFEELRSHQLNTTHLHCDECDLYFSNYDEHLLHVRGLQHATQNHCCDCKREYTNDKALANHCCRCDKVFKTGNNMARHLAKGCHIGETTSPKLQQICEECDETFASAKTLRRHKSSKHKAVRHIPCPVGETCSKRFATPSALLNHLESGACASGITRAKMAELVCVHDPNRYITSIDVDAGISVPVLDSTSTTQLSSTADSVTGATYTLLADEPTLLPFNATDNDTAIEWSFVDAVQSTPTTSEDSNDWSLVASVPLTPDVILSSSEWSFTGDNLIKARPNIPAADMNRIPATSTTQPPASLRCHLCPPTRRPFGSGKALQAHAASAVHAPKIFHCPLSILPTVEPEVFAQAEKLIDPRRLDATSGGGQMSWRR